jgi:hypothetical protein
MSTFNADNEKMMLIINIQSMYDRINKQIDFEYLWQFSADKLRELQEKIIIDYNNSFNKD